MAQAFLSSNMKQLNRKAVFDMIRVKRQVTRTELGRLTGISAPTMLKIFEHFTSIGLIREEGEQDSPIGRKASLYIYQPDSFYSLGVDFLGDAMVIGLVDLDNRVIKTGRYPVDMGFLQCFPDLFVNCVGDFIARHKIDASRILGLGIGCPTTVDNKNTILLAPLMDIREPVNMTAPLQVLEEELGIPVLLENDTNAAAKGEYESCHFHKKDSLVFLSLSRGLGAGIVLDGGKIWHGSRYLAGEVGYLVFDKNYRKDQQKPGWMEESYLKCTQGMNCLPGEKGRFIEELSTLVSLLLTNMAVVLDVPNFVIGGTAVRSFAEELVLEVKRKVHRLCISPIVIRTCAENEPVIAGLGSLVRDQTINRILE